MQQRLTKFAVKSEVDIRERNPALLALEGWYDVVTLLNSGVADLYTEYKSSGSTLKFTRWLSRFKKLDNAVVSEIGRSMVETSVKLSCRHNDLLRLGETQHYKSCMSNLKANGRQQLQYLADPDIAVLFSKDAAGKYVWRCLLRLAYNTYGDLCLVHYRIYGNGPSHAIFHAVCKKTGMKIYQATDIREGSDPSDEYLVSPTVHNNRFLNRPIWTDHYQGMTNQNRIRILARSVPVAY